MELNVPNSALGAKWESLLENQQGETQVQDLPIVCWTCQTRSYKHRWQDGPANQS